MNPNHNQQWTQKLTIAKIISEQILDDQTEFVQALMEFNFFGMRMSTIKYGRECRCLNCGKTQFTNNPHEFNSCDLPGCCVGVAWRWRSIKKWYLITKVLYDKLSDHQEPTLQCKGVCWWGCTVDESELIFHPSLKAIAE